MNAIEATPDTELENVLPASHALEIELCWEPVWTPDRMCASARRIMGW